MYEKFEKREYPYSEKRFAGAAKELRSEEISRPSTSRRPKSPPPPNLERPLQIWAPSIPCPQEPPQPRHHHRLLILQRQRQHRPPNPFLHRSPIEPPAPTPLQPPIVHHQWLQPRHQQEPPHLLPHKYLPPTDPHKNPRAHRADVAPDCTRDLTVQPRQLILPGPHRGKPVPRPPTRQNVKQPDEVVCLERN
ncbi:hypothetical protein STAS_28740 [Striga asiatica]|uniref:Uncharacterized protein n=1 Tax=Striga asiatica TaxID=4170 RepID=A0A5A7R112_STRAF|nr:hypothetical protein STAS_28740 [Striga asiatica]